MPPSLPPPSPAPSPSWPVWTPTDFQFHQITRGISFDLRSERIVLNATLRCPECCPSSGTQTITVRPTYEASCTSLAGFNTCKTSLCWVLAWIELGLHILFCCSFVLLYRPKAKLTEIDIMWDKKDGNQCALVLPIQPAPAHCGIGETPSRTRQSYHHLLSLRRPPADSPCALASCLRDRRPVPVQFFPRPLDGTPEAKKLSQYLKFQSELIKMGRLRLSSTVTSGFRGAINAMTDDDEGVLHSEGLLEPYGYRQDSMSGGFPSWADVNEAHQAEAGEVKSRLLLLKERLLKDNRTGALDLRLKRRLIQLAQNMDPERVYQTILKENEERELLRVRFSRSVLESLQGALLFSSVFLAFIFGLSQARARSRWCP